LLLAPVAIAAEKAALVLNSESGQHRFEVEIAATDETRRVGLMFRRSLGEQEGMLFLYEPPQLISMWMQNTYIPLDMIFIDADNRVHRIVERTEPFSTDVIESGGVVKGVLEVNAGTAARIGLKPGDRVSYDVPALAPAQ
jgi:uncharacterized membrane protein (UPF0127 family)